jgi:hypothetical protein
LHIVKQMKDGKVRIELKFIFKVGICVSDGTAQQVSFVNSICTTRVTFDLKFNIQREESTFLMC